MNGDDEGPRCLTFPNPFQKKNGGTGSAHLEKGGGFSATADKSKREAPEGCTRRLLSGKAE